MFWRLPSTRWPGENIDFGTALDGVLTQLPVFLEYWIRSYVDEIQAEDQSLDLSRSIAKAKSKLISGLEAGADLVLYNGHGTTSQLSNKGLLKAGDIAGN